MSGVSRRSFLKILGGAAAAVVAQPLITSPVAASPLFVPAERLDFGVPREIVTARSLDAAEVRDLWQQHTQRFDAARARATMADAVPMTLLQSEYLAEYGGKLPAGHMLLVPGHVAERWVRAGVAVAAAGAPMNLRNESVRVQAERQKERDERGAPWPFSAVAPYSINDPSAPSQVVPSMESLLARIAKATASAETTRWWAKLEGAD